MIFKIFNKPLINHKLHRVLCLPEFAN